MLKKVLISVGGVGLLTAIFFGDDAFSYVWTSAHRVKESVRNSVPLEFEIDRARQMVRDLVPDIRRNMHVIAREEVEVERLEKQIEGAESKIDRERTDVKKLTLDLKQGRSVYHYAGRRYSDEQVRADLARRFERYKTSEATVASLQQILEARQRSLEAARQKLEGMLAAKRNLQVEVENLDARLKLVEVAQTTSEFALDDSRLSRVKDHMAQIRARLSVAEKLLNADVSYHDEIPLEAPVPEDIVDQVTEYFELDRPSVAELAEIGP